MSFIEKKQRAMNDQIIILRTPMVNKMTFPGTRIQLGEVVVWDFVVVVVVTLVVEDLVVEDALVVVAATWSGILDLSTFQSVQSVLVSLQGGIHEKHPSEEADAMGQVASRVSQNFLQGY